MTMPPYLIYNERGVIVNRLYRDNIIHVFGGNEISESDFKKIDMPRIKMLKLSLASAPSAIMGLQDEMIKLMEDYPPSDILIRSSLDGKFLFSKSGQRHDGYDEAPWWTAHLRKTFEEVRAGRVPGRIY